MTEYKIADMILAKSDQLNAEDLLGREMVIKITKVTKKDPKKPQPLWINYEGDDGGKRPYKPCKGMIKIIFSMWGENESNYIGRSLSLYRFEEAVYAGKEVGGLRLNGMSHIEKSFKVKITESRNKKVEYSIKKLEVAVESTITQDDVDELMVKGAEASLKGVVGYTTWGKSLSVEERSFIKSKRAEWLAVAEGVDNPTPEPEAEDEPEVQDDEFPV